MIEENVNELEIKLTKDGYNYNFKVETNEEYHKWIEHFYKLKNFKQNSIVKVKN